MGRKKKEIAEDVNLKGSKLEVQVPIEAQEKLIRLMNDSPTIMKLHGTEWEIHSLKPAVQWLICEEATEIVKVDNMTIGDVLKALAKEMPRVVRVMAYAMLNDKDRIFNNYRQRIYSEEFEDLYDTLMWGDIKIRDWAQLLMEIVNLVDVSFFFLSTDAIQTIRKTSLERKITMEEQKQLLQGLNMEK